MAETPGFWTTVRLLLRVARKRFDGRKRRQQELLNQRTGKQNSVNWGWLGVFFSVFLALVIHGLAAGAIYTSVIEGERAQRNDKRIVVSQPFYRAVLRCDALQHARIEGDEAQQKEFLTQLHSDTEAAQEALNTLYTQEARRIREVNETTEDAEKRLRQAVSSQGLNALAAEGQKSFPKFRNFLQYGPLPSLLGTVVLLWWLAMMVCQGEGLELDLQRRRHPMWEWLFSHPVPTGAVFFAEMLTPLAANPIYWAAPIFPAALFLHVYGIVGALAGFFVVGIPVTIAAASLGKAMEIGILLRCSMRTRGAILGLMSWLGYATMMMFLFAMAVVPTVIRTIWQWLMPLTAVPWPLLRLVLGVGTDGSRHLLQGLGFCLITALLVTAAAVWFSIEATQKGLSGNLSAADTRPKAVSRKIRFGRDPLYRKEMLWFLRDRGAIVQAFLIPMTIAGFQLFNMRGLLVHAGHAWNYLCGAGILFGTYFLWVLGPKSLTSEGQALWISLTWPRGLESLLKAKAWLWAMISTIVVMLIFAAALWRFPSDGWKIALVGVGWFFFARSMAEKSVTLVTVTSESGETHKIPAGRRWATMLGMMTFSIGIMTQQWNLAIVGIVYSMMTAAAMWQNFRARLPYLFDAWSERVPPAPTLMHAMVAISILIESSAVVMGMFFLFMGHEHLAISRALGYAISAVVVSVGTMYFLAGRGVGLSDILLWIPERRRRAMDQDDYEAYLAQPEPLPLRKVLSDTFGASPFHVLGVILGACLACVAMGYQLLIHHIPTIGKAMDQSQQMFADSPEMRISWFVMAVFFAPVAEEYLFRGLLFRALDEEWGGWRAVLASAAFFAIYHPPLAWIPVATVGAVNAVLYKKSRNLMPCILLHMTYNAVVMWR